MTPTCMLDTDSVSFALKGRGNVGAHLKARRPSEVCISAITLAELRYGADLHSSKKLHRLIDAFTSAVQVIPFDDAAAAAFGKVTAELAKAGTPIGDFDALIAAHALSHRMVIVTNNTKHFSAVKGLRLDNWLEKAI